MKEGGKVNNLGGTVSRKRLTKVYVEDVNFVGGEYSCVVSVRILRPL